MDSTGALNAATEKYCSNCGQVISRNAEICPKCGVRQMDAPVAPYAPQGAMVQGRKSKVAAALFGILLGGFGAHKFYLGQVGMGFLYLIFFWTFIPAIAGLIEGIIYLTMSDQDFARKYG